jgi:hypothetical protein
MSASTGSYRRAVATSLDDLVGPYPLSGATASTITVPSLVSGDANASPTRYGGRWAYLASGLGAGQTRRVRANSFVAASGMLSVDPPWTTVPSGGDRVELYGFFPPTPQVGEDTSYLGLLNAALRRLVAPDRVGIAITTSQEYSLTTLPWLDRDERLVAIWEPGVLPSSLPIPADWRRPRLRLDAESPVLELAVPFASATGALRLDVLRPADTWIKTAGVWAESTTGLVNETDEALPSVEDVEAEALAEAYFSLMSRSPARPNGAWGQKWQAQREIARARRRHDATQERTVVAPPGNEASAILQPTPGGG